MNKRNFAMSRHFNRNIGCQTGTKSGFRETVLSSWGSPLHARAVETLQVNIGYRCNLSCRHCHVEGGPGNPIEMDAETIGSVLRALESPGIRALDITGGAPELNPGFRELVAGARGLGKHVITRTNLAIFFEPGQEDIPEFLAGHGLEVTASLPCYTAANVDAVRGKGVFEKSVKALSMLNSLGYGKGDGLVLNLVYNPAGAFMPGSQKSLEEDYKKQLKAYDIVFDRLFTFTNMPVGRFRSALDASGELGAYQEGLRAAFNPATLDGLMCRSLMSVGPDGTLYDCDFNQAASLGLGDGLPRTISEFDLEALATRPISVDEHCFGCTAGSGST